MTPALQLMLVSAIVLVALGYLARRAWRQLALARRKRGCGAGCDCG